MGEKEDLFTYVFSIMDDALLAMIEDPSIHFESDDPHTRIDYIFRGALATIQARNSEDEMSDDDVIRFLQNRVSYLISDCPNKNQRLAYVSSGLPYLCARNLHRDLEAWKEAADEATTEGLDIERAVQLLEWIEEWARVYGAGVIEEWPKKAVFDDIRADWIGGVPASKLKGVMKDSMKICKDVYGYQLPWLIHAGSQLFAKEGHEAHSECLGVLAALVELGLPNMTAVNIFLSGVRSRAAACELADLDEEWKSGPGKVRRQLCDPGMISRIEPLLGNDTKCWLRLLKSDSAKEGFPIPEFQHFTLIKHGENLPDKIVVRKHNNSIFLCTPDGRQRVAVQYNPKWPFMHIANDLRFAFRFNGSAYQLETRDPRLRPDDDACIFNV